MKNSYYRQLRAFLAVAVLLVVGASSALAQWTALKPLNAERSWHQVAIAKTNNDRLYTFGGYGIPPGGTGMVFMSQAHYLGIDGGQQWNSAAGMPQPRFGGYATTINNKVYLLGGLVDASTSYTFDISVQEFDPATNTYTPKAQMQAPMAWFGGATVGNKIYLIGGVGVSGTSVVLSPQVWVYDVVQDNWTKINDAPMPGQFMTASAVGNTIYLVGGSTGQNQLAYSNKVYKGTIAGNTITWSPVADLPVSLTRSTSGVLNGKLYVGSGATADGASAKMWIYDEVGNKWDATYPLPTATYNAPNMVSDGTALFLVGGYDNPNVYKYVPGAPAAVAAMGNAQFLIGLKTGSQKDLTTTLRNDGVIALTGTVEIPSPSANWLSTTTPTINVQPGQTMNISLKASAASVPEGEYTATVLVKTNDANNSEIPVTIRLFVRDNLVEQPANVSLEEASGAWCGPCGAYGVPLLEQLEGQYGERLTIISYHHTGGRGLAADTMATQETESISNRLDINAFPGASVQRMIHSGLQDRYVPWTEWAARIADVLAAQPVAPAALEITDYNYNPTTRQVTAKVKVSTSTPMAWAANSSLRVTAVVMEDSIRSPQAGNSTNPFYHMSVVKNIGPSIDGQNIPLPPNSTIESNSILLPGIDAEGTITFAANRVGYPSRARVAFLVHINNGTSFGPVLQSVEMPLAQVSNPSLSLSTDKLSQTVPTQSEAVFTTVVKNLTNAPLTVDVQRTQNDIANDWTAHFCIDNDCKGDNEHTGNVILQPNQTASVTVHVNTGTVQGDKGEVSLRFAGGNVDQTIKYTTTNSTSGSGSVGMTAVAGNGLRLEQNVPNPASGVTSFGYYMPTAGNVTVEVYTMAGYKVINLAQGRLEAGNHSVAIDATTMPNGIYNVVVNVNGTRVTRTMTVLH